MKRKLDLPLISLMSSSVLCITISIISLNLGHFIVFQNFFYIPIVIACFYYRKKGFIISIALSLIYFSLILAYTGDPTIIREALTRVFIFVLIASVVCALSTARAKAEKMLNYERDKFRAVADFTYDWEYWTDPEQKMLYASPSCERICGYCSDDFMADSGLIADIIHKDDLESYKQHADTHHKINTDSVGEIDFRILTREGVIRWISHVCQPVYSGEGHYLGRRASNRDITEQIKAQKELLIKEWAIESAINAMAIADLRGNLTYVNPAFLKMWGYFSSSEVLGKSSIKFWEVEDVAAEIIKALRVHGNWSGEAVGRRKDGPLFDVQVTASMVVDSAGRPINMLASFVDITLTKKTEEELRQREKRFATAFLKASVPAAITSIKDGRYIEVSDSFLNMMGMERGEVIGNTSTGIGFITKEQRDLFLEEFNQKGSIENLEMPIITAGNENRYGLFNSVIVTLAGEDHFLTVVTDITERKKAEGALKESEEKYRDIFNKTVEGIYRTTTDGKFVVMNPALARICGYSSPEEMLEKVTDISNQVYANPEDRLKFQKLIEIEEEVKGFEVQFKHPSKGLVWISIHAKAIRDEHGNIQYYDGTVEDITERKHAEEVLAEEHKKLKQALAEVRTLQGIIPICAWCKKIRDDKGYWNQVEKYVSEHTEARFSHGICPECEGKLHLELYEE